MLFSHPALETLILCDSFALPIWFCLFILFSHLCPSLRSRAARGREWGAVCGTPWPPHPSGRRAGEQIMKYTHYVVSLRDAPVVIPVDTYKRVILFMLWPLKDSILFCLSKLNLCTKLKSIIFKFCKWISYHNIMRNAQHKNGYSFGDLLKIIYNHF